MYYDMPTIRLQQWIMSRFFMCNKQHLSYMFLRDYNSELTADCDMDTPPYTASATLRGGSPTAVTPT